MAIGINCCTCLDSRAGWFEFGLIPNGFFQLTPKSAFANQRSNGSRGYLCAVNSDLANARRYELDDVWVVLRYVNEEDVRRDCPHKAWWNPALYVSRRMWAAHGHSTTKRSLLASLPLQRSVRNVSKRLRRSSGVAGEPPCRSAFLMSSPLISTFSRPESAS